MSKKADARESGQSAQSLIRLERLSRLIRSASHTHSLNAAQWEALRFIAKANCFSNSPGALSHYLGATKGTVSQTVLSLIKKGVVEKSARGADGRSVSLAITEAGQKILSDDPLLHVETALAQLGQKTARRFAKGLDEILQAETNRQGQPDFGACLTCRHATSKGEVHCGVFKINMPTVEVQKLCLHHAAKP